ncbi:MAG: D-alanine--D-alanine ligase family protein [Spirochaetaceae bacterium]
MSKERIGILFGGKSGEHEVSLVSAASVMKHLAPAKFVPVMIGIDRNGRWYLQEEPRVNTGTHAMILQNNPNNRVYAMPGDGLYCRGESLKLDVVFPVLHGTNGEDGTIQGFLEIAHLPYVGAGVLGSSLSMDKAAVKRIWRQAGLKVVPFILARREKLVLDDKTEDRALESGAFDTLRRRVEEAFSYPLFVKPSRAGSSVGVARAENKEELAEALKDAFRFDTKVLIEPEIRGREIECSVIGNEKPEAFVPGEIVPSHQFYDYKAKYIDPDGAELLVPAPLDNAQQEMVKKTSILAYRAAEAEGMARVDCFIERESGEIYLNEINTIPGFTGISMFSKLCEASGLSYPLMLERIIDLAHRRYRRQESLSYQ